MSHLPPRPPAPDPELIEEENDSKEYWKDSTSTLITFIALKILKQIDWSWWWVFSPLWIPVLWAFVSEVILIYWEDLQARKKRRDWLRSIKKNNNNVN